ncbi:zinc binding dehydrogenase [Penicillium alfredii]|uniref:Zinc binding dehydrogenase n=1 Tax=Penicillium alfredii TaxID=1506179 RepID=A0A9W9FQC4_9EURO|nr:zinc binding dehydrogenase [Penicillium alfredii]KAJ5104426.1 zinc binding dehydrogenase [Penicillium alfredii]
MTLRAVQIQQYNEPYHVSDVPVPQPKPHQVLVQIKAAGLCHTDLMALNNEFNTPLPFIGSHELAGLVAEVGVDVTGFQKGDRVGCINFDSVCGKCADRKAGLLIYCEAPSMKGITTDGFWAEYMVADARFIVKLPDNMGFKVAAPLMCAGISIYGSIVRAGVPKGGSIGIVGIGGLGHIGTQVAKCMEYAVAAIDIKPSALNAVASYPHSPDALILATDPVEDSRQKIDQMVSSNYRGLDATVLATDHPAAFELAAALTRKHGTMVLLGQPEKGLPCRTTRLSTRISSLLGLWWRIRLRLRS